MAAKAKTTIVYAGNEKAAKRSKKEHETKADDLGYPSVSVFARRAMDELSDRYKKPADN